MVGSLLFVLSSSILLSLMSATFNLKVESNPGGITGLFIADFIRNLLSIPGAYIFSLAVFLSSIVLLSPVSLVSLALGGKKKETDEDKPPEEPFIEENIIQGVESLEHSMTESIQQFAPLFKPVNTRPRRAGDYTLPSLEMLNVYDSGIRPSKDELLTSSSLLVQKLSDFDVDGKITQVQAGPIVTMYEFEPAPGVKINRVVSLSDDLALALKAQGVRVAPISGKSAIGIEVRTGCARQYL